MKESSEWIKWGDHPPPEDIRGILIQYENGFIEPDRYDHRTKKRKYREDKIVGWKFIPRKENDERSIQCNKPHLKNPFLDDIRECYVGDD